MKAMESNLIELVREAQNGSQIALWEIIQRFSPAINRVKRKTSSQERDDLEQEIIEKMIRAILLYEIKSSIDLTQFKHNIQSFVGESEATKTQEGEA